MDEILEIEEGLTLVTTVVWGMLAGTYEDIDRYIDEQIETEKSHVAQRLSTIGFAVVSQEGVGDIGAEGCYLITKAKMVNKLFYEPKPKIVTLGNGKRYFEMLEPEQV